MNDSSGLRSVRLADYEPVAPDLLKILPEGLVKRRLIVPIGREQGRLIAAVPKAEGNVSPDGLKIFTGCAVELVLAPQDEIEDFIRRHYSDEGDELNLVPEALSAPVPVTTVSTSPIVLPSVLNRILTNGTANRASEVLIEREGTQVRVRNRIRGVLVSELKDKLTLSDVQDIFSFVIKNGTVKSTESVQWAEWHTEFMARGDRYLCDLVLSDTKNFGLVTVQFRQPQAKAFLPESWGMGPNQARVLDQMLHRSQGVVLFCGPESEDLTRNMHACAKELATSERHLIAVESLLEEWLPNMEQLISKGDPDFFTNLLKVSFRHSPDMVLVNPIEKREHMEICLIEALKGRLILGRAFALDAARAFLQYLAMGIEPYLIGSSLLGVVAQRSLRLNCPQCQEKEIVNRDILRELNIPIAMQPAAFYRGRGCEKCLNTGFDRETSIFEVLEITPEMRGRLSRQMSLDDINNVFKSNGMMTLRQVALHKAINGQTSLSEVLRATP